jgi:hypothetical protein
MNKLLLAAILSFIFLPVESFSQAGKTFFQTIAGNWEGTLEYQDYSPAANKRVTLKIYLTITPAPDGSAAEFQTVYDDFGRIIKNRQTYKIDSAAREYSAGDSEYKIDSIETGRIVLLGRGQDGEKIEPIRQTISFDADNLNILKETRTPWRFRSRSIFRRSSENVLEKKTFAAAELREDFEIFKKTVTALHPGIFRYQTKESLEKLFAGYQARLTNPLSEAEFFKFVAELTSQFYCGHTYLNPNNQKSLLRERLFGGKTYLPFYFRIVDGKIIVTENASAQNLANGSEILKINGMPAKKIIEKLLTVTGGDGRNTLAHRMQGLELTRFRAERYALFDWYFPLFFPLADENYTIEAADFATRKKVKFQAAALTKEARTAEIEKRYGKAPTYDDGWKFEVWNDGTAYLKIENSITWRLKNIKYKEFLATAFATIRARGVKNLIIDLRGNDGGDSDIGFELAKYLARENLPPFIADRRLIRNVAARADLLKYLDTYRDELKNNLKNGVPANSYQKAGNEYFEILPNENVTNYPAVVPYENNFAGKIYIISDASNASAAFLFLNYAQANRLGAIVGQATGGNKQGINGGNYFFLYLPHSKIEIDIPVYFLAPLTAQKDESVIPDIAVRRQPRDTGNNFDRELAVIKDLIEKN